MEINIVQDSASRLKRVQRGPFSLLFGILMWVGFLSLVWVDGCSQHYEEGTHPPKPPPQTQLPAGHPTVEGGQSPSFDAKGSVRGTIRISKELASRIPPNAYLHIIARERADGGVPYALKMMRVPQFPYAYTLTQADVAPVFGEGIVLVDIPEMYLVAKVDQDGKVGAQPGDLEGSCPQNPVAAGEAAGNITIDRMH